MFDALSLLSVCIRRNVSNTLGIRPHPLLTHVIDVISKMTGDNEAGDAEYLGSVKGIVNTEAITVLMACVSDSESPAVVLLCELTLQLYAAVAKGHKIDL